MAFTDIIGRINREIEQIVDEAAEITRGAYSSGDTNDEFDISVSHDGNTHTITASGKQVGFLEWGAGIGTDPDELVSEVSYEVYDGSYSKAHNGPYFRKGYWTRDGRRLIGLIPTHGMKMAKDHIIERVQSL